MLTAIKIFFWLVYLISILNVWVAFYLTDNFPVRLTALIAYASVFITLMNIKITEEIYAEL